MKGNWNKEINISLVTQQLVETNSSALFIWLNYETSVIHEYSLRNHNKLIKLMGYGQPTLKDSRFDDSMGWLPPSVLSTDLRFFVPVGRTTSRAWFDLYLTSERARRSLMCSMIILYGKMSNQKHSLESLVVKRNYYRVFKMSAVLIYTKNK